MSSTERAASSGSSSTWIKMRTISSRSRRRAATSNGSSKPALNSRSLVVMPAYSGCMDPLPNGSRLSCGANARGRKRLALRHQLAGAQTNASSESRPRQLQALVRRLLETRLSQVYSRDKPPNSIGLSPHPSCRCQERECIEHSEKCPCSLRRSEQVYASQRYRRQGRSLVGASRRPAPSVADRKRDWV